MEQGGPWWARAAPHRRDSPPGRWLRLQGTLKEHHEALQLALEVAAFLQQAEALLGAIHAKVAAPGRVARRGEGPRGARAGGQSQGSKRGRAGGIGAWQS